MKLYLIFQSENNDYNTYSSAVVAAESEEEAKKIKPDGDIWGEEWKPKGWHGCGTWASSPEEVEVEYIGEAKNDTKMGVICASFHAG